MERCGGKGSVTLLDEHHINGSRPGGNIDLGVAIRQAPQEIHICLLLAQHEFWSIYLL